MFTGNGLLLLGNWELLLLWLLFILDVSIVEYRILLWRGNRLFQTFWYCLKVFDVFEFSYFSLSDEWWSYPFFQNSHFKICYRVSKKVEMLFLRYPCSESWLQISLPKNYFTQNVPCLSYVESWGVLLADYIIYHIGGRVREGPSNLVRACDGMVGGKVDTRISYRVWYLWYIIVLLFFIACENLPQVGL